MAKEGLGFNTITYIATCNVAVFSCASNLATAVVGIVGLIVFILSRHVLHIPSNSKQNICT